MPLASGMINNTQTTAGMVERFLRPLRLFRFWRLTGAAVILAVFLSTISFGADPIAPTTPTGVILSVDSSTQITVTWNASSDAGSSALPRYHVYRNGLLVAQTGATSYVVTGLVANAQYCYTVVAYDHAGNKSSPSAQVCSTMPALVDTTTPSIPGNVSATANSSTQITVTWNASSDAGSTMLPRYQVYRSGALVSQTGATNYVVTGLVANTRYCYTVVA